MDPGTCSAVTNHPAVGDGHLSEHGAEHTDEVVTAELLMTANGRRGRVAIYRPSGSTARSDREDIGSPLLSDRLAVNCVLTT